MLLNLLNNDIAKRVFEKNIDVAVWEFQRNMYFLLSMSYRESRVNHKVVSGVSLTKMERRMSLEVSLQHSKVYTMRTTKRQQLLTNILALNLLTPQVLKAAATEIQLGTHVQLDWAMHHLDYPGFGRLQYEHRIKDLREKGFVGFDDELTINTQTSSQWDGLKHVSGTSALLHPSLLL